MLLGLDGASWNVMEPMLRRGALPNLQRMIVEGVSAPLESALPCISISLWTSIATGKTPEEHGIADWSYVDSETGEKGLMNSTRRRVPALWNIGTAAGIRVGFINWWATWPAEIVEGYIVSEQMTRVREGESLESGVYPESLSGALGQELTGETWPWLSEQLRSGALKVLSDRDADGERSFEERYRQAFFLYGQDVKGERALFHLFATAPHPQLLGYLSRKIDIASHYMWQFGEEERPSDEALSRILEPVYRYEDELLGRLLDLAGPDVNVIVLSDHGFTWEGNGLGHEETAPAGIFVAMGPAFEASKRLEKVRLYDIAPIVLHALELPVATDMAGEPLLDAFADDRQPRLVESYDPITSDRTSGTSPFEERIRRELEALGYLH